MSWATGLALASLVLGGCGQGGTASSDTASKPPASCEAVAGGDIPDGSKWLPIHLNHSHPSRHCPGRDLAIVEVRGWIRGISPECNKDPDYGLDLEVDSSWAVKAGWTPEDFNRLFDVGSILARGMDPDPSSTPLHMVATPLIHMEVWAFSPANHPNSASPASWFSEQQLGESFGPKCPGALWPYDPRRPLARLPALKVDQYVRVVGSLVSDGVHTFNTGDDDEDIFGKLCYFNGLFFCSYPGAQRQAAYAVWGGDGGLARWAEIHPPDLIEVLADTGCPASPSPPTVPTTTTTPACHPSEVAHGETLRGFAVVSDHCLIGPCAAAEVSVDIFPAGPKPPNAKVGYVEMVSQVPGETYTKTIEIGNANHDGAEITPLPDRIHVRVKVRGQSLKGLPGRFKALYRVFWTT